MALGVLLVDEEACLALIILHRFNFVEVYLHSLITNTGRPNNIQLRYRDALSLSNKLTVLLISILQPMESQFQLLIEAVNFLHLYFILQAVFVFVKVYFIAIKNCGICHKVLPIIWKHNEKAVSLTVCKDVWRQWSIFSLSFDWSLHLRIFVVLSVFG